MKKYLILGLFVSVITFAGLSGMWVARSAAVIEDTFEEILPEEVITELTETVMGPFNVLLVGTDGGDKLTDTMMLVNVDMEKEAVSIVSLMRDTRVKMDGYHTKLNAIHAYHGMDGLLAAVKELTGSPIHYYVKVDLDGFVDIIDYLGGVNFDVPQNMYYSDPTQGLLINLKAGEQLLDGDKSMQLVRYRQYVDGDVGRTRVQQAFMQALIEQHMTATNLIRLPEMFAEFAKYVETSVTLEDIIENIPNVKLFTTEGAVSVYEFPGVGRYVGNISYYVHDSEATYELFALHFMGTGEPLEKLYSPDPVS